ncbi:hypothetical protein TRP8649_01313 [Pelagimonas phthalicica]|uniref:Uncharacterized protein n=1 Tax=Pelagimonas phthalicica TaxID=1037362 RepID=A0A238J921_9RHOB|nr:hypothetical protein CLV87_0759 [Pelagimonas phthalicica]SMX27211.1 hypothetical protein TRP8649_01313 [Pelagimonas phthalicica]
MSGELCDLNSAANKIRAERAQFANFTSGFRSLAVRGKP